MNREAIRHIRQGQGKQVQEQHEGHNHEYVEQTAYQIEGYY